MDVASRLAGNAPREGCALGDDAGTLVAASSAASEAITPTTPLLETSESRSRRFKSLRTFRSMLIAEVTVFLQTFINDPLELARSIRVKLHCRYGDVLCDRKKQDAASLTVEGHFASRHLVECHAE